MTELGLEFIKNLELVKIIEYFDGPLMIQYKNIKFDDDTVYIVSWIDLLKEENFNRWILLQLTKNSLNEYLTSKISLKELMKKTNNNLVHIVDSNDQGKYVNIFALSLDQIPNEYLPTDDSMFDPSLMPRND